MNSAKIDIQRRYRHCDRNRPTSRIDQLRDDDFRSDI